MTSYILSPEHIHIVFDNGKSVTVYNSQQHFDGVVAAVKIKDWKTAYNTAFPINHISEQLQTVGKQITENVTISHGVVYFDDVAIHGTLIDRILQMSDAGFDVTYMGLFLTNLMKNTSHRAVNELYGFLEKSNLPITEDGHFLAYKRVTSNFKDIRTRTFDNSPGSKVFMTRNAVNEDKNDTCSTGLHFCSYDYLRHYGNVRNSKIIMVKINPRDVVTIPTDYDNAKGRCCKYQVVCEIDKETTKTLPNEETRIENKKVLVVQPGAVQQINIDKKSNKLILATHDSITAAAKATGIPASAIRRVCNGDRKTTGGFGWKWVKFTTTSNHGEYE